MADFTSARTKLNRAAAHYTEFQRILTGYLGSQPVSLTQRPNPDGISEDYYVAVQHELPAELNTIFGDCIHNLRCVLDHLVVALAVENGGDPNDRRTAFPVCMTATGFQHERGRSLHFLNAAAQDFIETVQPYNRHGNPWTLVELSFLDNRDKHRSVIDHRLEIAAEIQYTTPGLTIEYATPLQLLDGAYYATVRYAPRYEGPKEQRPPIVGLIGIQRSNLIGFLDARGFLRDDAFPFVRGILHAAATRFR